MSGRRSAFATWPSLLWAARCRDPAGWTATGAMRAAAHVLVEEAGTGTLVCCFRLLHLRSGGQIERSYCAKYYDLSRLGNFPAPMLELGRFCLHPDHHHPDIMRTAWAAITRHVDQAKVEMLFGCSSFHGTWHRPSGDPGSGRPILSVFRSC